MTPVSGNFTIDSGTTFASSVESGRIFLKLGGWRYTLLFEDIATFEAFAACCDGVLAGLRFDAMEQARKAEARVPEEAP